MKWNPWKWIMCAWLCRKGRGFFRCWVACIKE